MAGPERRFINRVHGKLHEETFKDCMTGKMGSNGTPDYYYEGPGNVLWVEYKAVDGKIPAQLHMGDSKKKYAPSALQRRWLNRAEDNRVPCAVVLGSDSDGIIFTRRTWNKSWLSSQFPPSNPKRIADFIEFIVLKGRSIDNWLAEQYE